MPFHAGLRRDRSVDLSGVADDATGYALYVHAHHAADAVVRSADPVRNMPAILQIVTYVNPLRFGVDLVRRVYLEGATFADVAFNFVPLLAVAAVTLPLAAWLFRNRLS